MNLPKLPFTVPSPVAGYRPEVLARLPAEGPRLATALARDLFGVSQGDGFFAALIFGTKLAPWEFDRATPPHTLWAMTLKDECTPHSREMLSRALPIILREMGAVAVAITFEAWMVKHEDRDTEALDKFRREHGSLEHHPGRIECVQALYETATSVELWVANILRADKVRLGCFEKMPETIHEGRFAGMLRPLDGGATTA